MVKTNAQIREDVRSELHWDTRVEPAEIAVAVKDGIVTLTGTASSWAKKIAASEAAHRVVGVLDVANDIAVSPAHGGTTESDTELAKAVRHALEWDVFVPDKDVQSTVANGLVVLTGEVDTWSQREDAARAVRNLAGVRAVSNTIAIRKPQTTPDALRVAIRDALERHADREAARIQIDIDGSRVTLRGDVQSWREHEAIVGTVTGTRGVEEIVDRLRVAY